MDAARFEALAARGGRELATGTPEEAASLLGEALALWRGPRWPTYGRPPFAGPAGARLEELRLAALEDCCDARLRLGDHAGALAELEAASADHPLRGTAGRAAHAGAPGGGAGSPTR